MTKYIFRLDEILKEKNRGIRDIARATGIAYATISRIVNHHTTSMNLNTLNKLCAELKVTPGQLYRIKK